MRGELPEIVGSTKPIYENYKCIPKTDGMFENFINKLVIIFVIYKKYQIIRTIIP